MPAGPAGEAEYREAQVQRRNLLPGDILFQLSHLVRERIYLLPSLGLWCLPLKENAFSLGLKF